MGFHLAHPFPSASLVCFSQPEINLSSDIPTCGSSQLSIDQINQGCPHPAPFLLHIPATPDGQAESLSIIQLFLQNPSSIVLSSLTLLIGLWLLFLLCEST